jgi:hypothetical protein
MQEAPAILTVHVDNFRVADQPDRIADAEGSHNAGWQDLQGQAAVSGGCRIPQPDAFGLPKRGGCSAVRVPLRLAPPAKPNPLSIQAESRRSELRRSQGPRHNTRPRNPCLRPITEKKQSLPTLKRYTPVRDPGRTSESSSCSYASPRAEPLVEPNESKVPAEHCTTERCEPSETEEPNEPEKPSDDAGALTADQH